MANLYGVANAPGMPIRFGPASDTNIPANVWTTVCSSPPMIAPSPGWFYPIVWVVISTQFASPYPADFRVGLAIGAGAVVDQFTMDAIDFSTGGRPICPGTLNGVASQVAWRGTGSVLNIQVYSATNPMIVPGYQTWCVGALYRAPDQ